MLMYLSGCVSKRENQGLFEYQLKKWRYKCWKCANEPQSYLKIQFSWNNPYLECFYLGIQVGSADMNYVFGLPPTFVTWDSKVTSTQIPFREHQSSENFKIMTWIQDFSHPRWFVPYVRLIWSLTDPTACFFPLGFVWVSHKEYFWT